MPPERLVRLSRMLRKLEGLHSFGYLAAGFQAVGYRPWDLR